GTPVSRHPPLHQSRRRPADAGRPPHAETTMSASSPPRRPAASEPYSRDNLLDRLSRRSTLERHYAHMMDRERGLIERRLGIRSGDVLSVGAGWHPGRHLFPSPEFRITAVDSDPAKVAGIQQTDAAEAALLGAA